jgi:hypothetical protein
LGFDEIPWEKSDPHMIQFVNKLRQCIEASMVSLWS